MQLKLSPLRTLVAGALGVVLIIGATIGGVWLLNDPSHRALMVKWRNSLIFSTYEQEKLGQYVAPMSPLHRNSVLDAFAENGIETWEQLIDYRRAKVIWGSLPNRLLLAERVRDCFPRHKSGGNCTCSDLSELTEAFCLAKGESCLQVGFGSTHSFNINLTRNEVVDLFLGYRFEGSLEELFQLVSTQNLSKDPRFHDLGPYLSGDRIRTYVPKPGRAQWINSQAHGHQLSLDQIHALARAYKGLVPPWWQTITDHYGDDLGQLVVHRYQYHWLGHEPLAKYINRNYDVQNSNFFLVTRELLGVLYHHLYAQHL